MTQKQYKDLIISGTSSKLAEGYVKNFENLIGHSLNLEFRDFLLSVNGGVPDKYLFDYYSSDNGEETVGDIVRFFGLEVDNISSLDRIFTRTRDRVKSSLMPIATSNSGDLICLGIQHPDSDKIFIWKHESETTDFIADKFDTFISNLRLPKSKEYHQKRGT